jgi:hypothetical protein
VPPATQTFCHVKEVVKTHITAFYRGKKGKNYILGGVKADFLTLSKEIGDMLGKQTPK